MTFLLDVNALFALHQPRHPDYRRVQLWFLRRPPISFATCPITQAGMVRLLMQQVAGVDRFRMDEARDALHKLISRSGHVFWPDDRQYLDATGTIFNRMQGHRQTTDAYLLGLAHYHGGKLATLDKAIPSLAGPELADAVEFIA